MNVLSQADLEALLAQGESEVVERKASLASKDRIAEAICAFANDLADRGTQAVVFVGAMDDGSCANLTITDQLLLELADLRTNGNIYPFPTMTVEKRTVGGCELAVVVVAPADNPPVRHRGRTWIRVGPQRAIATPEEERRLVEKRRAANLPFDVQPVRGAGIHDLDFDLFQTTYLSAAVADDVLRENERSPVQQLTSLRFSTPDGTPTVVGLLTIGRNLRAFIPGAYVQFIRFAGQELSSEIKAQREIDGPLPELLGATEEVLTAHTSVTVHVTSGPVEVRYADYPIVALQQLVRNAILHRTYEGTNAPVRINWFDDRIEIQNPGGPFGQVTLENFGQPGVTDYRNPTLAEAMKVLGFVQRFGIGIALAQRELQKNGNPPAEFKVEAAHVLVVVSRRP
ncbi:MAG: ATP-binding protein [Pseudomonadota bacterium]